MSGKAEKKAAAAPEEGAPKKGKGMLFIIIGLVVVLAGGGGAAFMMMQKSDKKAQAAKGEKHAKQDAEHEEEGEEEAEADDAQNKKKPVFYSLEPFVVNLAGDSQHYLQVGVDLKLSKEDYMEKIKTVLPEIRNGVVLLLSSKQATEVVSIEDKNHLRAEIRAVANKAIGVKDKVKRRIPAEEAGGAHAAEHDDEEDTGPAKGVTDVLLTSFVIQ
ncbi:MAG: DUF4366 domain-containing protein [Betaproteobacteria bacterium]|nr:DUF4366 domain-containing protein [Betaproteobacteria bacterium]